VARVSQTAALQTEVCMRKVCSALACAALVAAAIATVTAAAPSGAIFTTVSDGSEVNYNIYQLKEDVYLDGGPGPGAPQGAAGLDDGVYVFQVTDPSGKTLLSTDPAACRQFTVVNGIITSTAPSPAGCAHLTGLDVDHGATTVQLMPYNDTPNPGGEYKVWITMSIDYLCSDANGNITSNVVDCTIRKGGSQHGFLPRYTKTDNYKVRGGIREIDTRFHDKAGNLLDGMGVTWTDTLGASNNKWSYENLALDIHHEAHVESVEDGTHSITIPNQAGCYVGKVYVKGVLQSKTGAQTVKVSVPTAFSGGLDTVFIDVYCK
jgi:hypothetical protein